MFDIDETLVHCVLDKNLESDVKLKILLPSGKKKEVRLLLNVLDRDKYPSWDKGGSF